MKSRQEIYRSTHSFLPSGRRQLLLGLLRLLSLLGRHIRNLALSNGLRAPVGLLESAALDSFDVRLPVLGLRDHLASLGFARLGGLSVL